MKAYLLPLSLWAAATATATAQTRVTGTLADSLSRSGEPYATVRLFNAKNQAVTSFLTDKDGNFSHVLTQRGKHTLSFQALGRKTVRRTVQLGAPTLALDTIYLAPSTQTLGTAVVEAQKALVKMETGKVTYDTEADTDSKTYTLLEMLRKVPLVTVDGQDNITVNGSSSFIVYVDGKPNPMFRSNVSQVLKGIPASYAKRIEVNTSPGAKYDAEGVGGVINIITQSSATGGQQKVEGHNGSFGASLMNQRIGADGFFSWKKKKLTLTVNASQQNQFVPDIRVDLFREQYDRNGTSTFQHHREQRQRSYFTKVSGSASYEFDAHNLLNISVGLRSYRTREDAQGTSTIGGSRLPSSLTYQEISRKRSNHTSQWVSADFEHRFAGVEGRRLTFSYEFTRMPETEEEEVRFTGGSSTFYNLTNRFPQEDNRSSFHVGQIDFTTPLAKGHQLSTGVKMTARVNHGVLAYYLDNGAGTYEYDRAGSSDYKQFSQIGATYAEYEGALKSFKLQAGLRYEHTWQQQKFYVGAMNDFSLNYGNLVPHAKISWSPSRGQNLGLTYTQRIYRPTLNELNPAEQQTSPTMLSYGNVNLDAEQSHRISLEYNFFSPFFYFNTQLSHQFSNNGIEDYRFVKDGIFHETFGNIVKGRTESLSLFANVNLSKKTRLYMKLEGRYRALSSDLLAAKNHGWEGDAMLGFQQEFPWRLKFSGNIFAYSKRYSLEGSGSSFLAAYGSITRAFLKDRLEVGVMAFSPLGSRIKQDQDLRSHDFMQALRVGIKVHAVGITLRYNFGNQKVKVTEVKRTIENNDTKESGGGTPGGFF